MDCGHANSSSVESSFAFARTKSSGVHLSSAFTTAE